MKVWKANPVIVAMLEERGALLGGAQLEHSYPHCWRCHHPVIFRATEQWFISLDTPIKRADGSETTFRQLGHRRDRQSGLGPGLGQGAHHQHDRHAPRLVHQPPAHLGRAHRRLPVRRLQPADHRRRAQPQDRRSLRARGRRGLAYHSLSKRCCPPSAKCAHCGGTAFRKETDILDVWFDSGVSWLAVCESDPDLKTAYNAFQDQNGSKRPEVLYLEGGDQHRGWFHSSLLTSVALRGRAPYSHVATAGWTLDEQGRAMSKSLGNGVDPVDIANRMGGEIVRLWVASVDFREDMAASENLMQRCAELYKKLRNTFRFLLGNLNGFDPARDRVPEAELLPLDRYMLARTRDLTEKILGWYEALRVPSRLPGRQRVRHRRPERVLSRRAQGPHVHLRASSQARRSAQTVLWQITEALVRLVAPILSFTADEVWEHLPAVAGREASVHLAQFPKPEEIFSEDPAPVIEEWKRLFAIRDVVFAEIEMERKQGKIGKGLDARVEVLASAEDAAFLNSHSKDALAEFLNVSAIEVRPASGMNEDDAPARLAAIASQAKGTKCNRCWRYTEDTADYGVWHAVCARCRSMLVEMSIAPPQPADDAPVDAPTQPEARK